MRTIEELIAIEKQYIEERLNEINNINFIKILQNNDLTIEEFAYHKAEHYLKTFNPQIYGQYGDIVDVIYAQEFEIEKVISKENSIIFGFPNKKMVWYSDDNSYNKEYCEQNQITTAFLPYRGGVICTTEKDLECCIVAKNAPINFSDIILLRLAEWFSSKTIENITINGNDILINGEKFLGMGFFNHEEMSVYGFHISFDIDSEFIQNVCKKESVKIPTNISKFGNYKREELVSEMISWLK